MAIVFAMRRVDPAPVGPQDNVWWDGYYDDNWWDERDGNASWETPTVLKTVPGLPDSEDVTLDPVVLGDWTGYRPTKVRITYTLHYVGGGGP